VNNLIATAVAPIDYVDYPCSLKGTLDDMPICCRIPSEEEREELYGNYNIPTPSEWIIIILMTIMMTIGVMIILYRRRVV